ncbi:helix-turn-helix domain-containing protein [Shewanella maritima]|uniref:helix-turn-helix domain-containing protein n=1 Tax=Shewanella maritima TaxID=2520507 RepID=UPI0037352124
MIDFKIRPAVSTKIILDYCDRINFHMPEQYDVIRNLKDCEPIAFKTCNYALETLEKNIEDKYFYYDMSSYISERWLTFFEDRLISYLPRYHSQHHTQASMLYAFYCAYPGVLASLDWQLIDQPTTLTLLAKRNSRSSSSKYDDLILFGFISKLVNSECIDIKSPILVNLPFDRGFYKYNLDMFGNVNFENGFMSVSVNKSSLEIGNKITFDTVVKEFECYDKVLAAVNMIDADDLSLTSLSFRLGLSERTLQRELKKEGYLVKDIIRHAKFKRALAILIKNKLNLKVTALECGYKDQAQLSHLFAKETGLSPQDYIEQHLINRAM